MKRKRRKWTTQEGKARQGPKETTCQGKVEARIVHYVRSTIILSPCGSADLFHFRSCHLKRMHVIVHRLSLRIEALL